jgi:hypothetical protein
MDPAPPPPRQWFPRANLSPALKPVGSDDEQRVHAVGDGSRALDGQATSPEGIQSIDLSFHTVFSLRIAAFRGWNMLSAG